MKKRIKLFCLLPLFLALFVACKKEGDIVVKPIKEFKPYTIDGFALQALDQYFDGVKVRELYGRTTLQGFAENQIAFDKDEIVMELKKKGTGETLYQQKFNIKDATNTVPKFYFDGIKMYDTYSYPLPVGNEYKANFYFDFPKEAGEVDVVAAMVEYYIDANLPNGFGIAGVTTVPIAANIKPGKWSDYFTLSPYPDFPPKSRPDSDFMAYICIKKSGSSMYFSGNDITDELIKVEKNVFQLQLPVSGTTEGTVQSIFVGWKQQGPNVSFQPRQDLVQLFPR